MRALLVPFLSLSLVTFPALAQSKKPAAPVKETPKEVPEAKIKWDGEWKLASEDSDQVEPLIDEHLKEMNFAKRVWWKRKLQASCKAYPSLDILAGESFSVTLGKEVPADVSTDGSSSEWKRGDGEKFQVSMKKDGPRITLDFKGDGCTITNVLSMRKSGKTLAMQITYTSSGLDAPFSYKLVFQRED